MKKGLGKFDSPFHASRKSLDPIVGALSQAKLLEQLFEPVAKLYGLGFLPVSPEHYDFLVVEGRRERPAVQAFLAALRDEQIRERVRALGMEPSAD
jgi:putative molybdopterin biosynthesis protein